MYCNYYEWHPQRPSISRSSGVNLELVTVIFFFAWSERERGDIRVTKAITLRRGKAIKDVCVTLLLCVSGPICWFSSQSSSLMCCCCFLFPNRVAVFNRVCHPFHELTFNSVVDQASAILYRLPGIEKINK